MVNIARELGGHILYNNIGYYFSVSSNLFYILNILAMFPEKPFAKSKILY